MQSEKTQKTSAEKKQDFSSPGLLKNSFFNGFGYIFNIALVFYLTPLIIHRLGKDAYGLWIIIVGLTGYLGLMDFGVRSALGKYFAEYAARKDYDQINRFLNTIWVLFWILMVLVSAVGGLIVYAFIDSFQIPDSYLEQARSVGYIFSLFLGLSFPLSIPLGVLSGFRRFDLINLNSLVIRSIRAFLIIFFLNGENALYRLLTIHVGCGILEYVVLYWVCFRSYPFLKIHFFKFDSEQLRKTLRFGFNSFVIKIADTVIFYTDTLLVGRFLSTALVAVYSPAESLIGHLRAMVITFINVTLPEASRLQSLGDYEKLRELAIKTTKYLTLFVLPISAAVLVFADEFIRLWLGDDFILAATIMKILIIPQAAGLIQYGLESALYGIGKHHALAKLMMVVAVMNFVLSLIFLQWWGVYGIAMGTAIPLFLGQSLGSPLISKKYYGLKLSVLFKRAIIPPVIITIPFLFVLFWINQAFEINGYFDLIQVFIFGFVCWLPAVIYLMDTNERLALHRALKSIGKNVFKKLAIGYQKIKTF